MCEADLFTGIAIVIDDEAERPETRIANLIGQIEDKKMPCIKYTVLPDKDTLLNFRGVSLLLLDWKLRTQELSDAEVEAGVKIPSELEDLNTKFNIEFLELVKSTFFAPVFIFTDGDTNWIVEKLKECGLFEDGKPNFILVKKKDELLDGKLFVEIKSWVRVTLPIYVMKEWEKEYEKAKNSLFQDFYQLSHSWPKILWDTFMADDVNVSMELGELITKNLYTRMAPFSFDPEIFKPEMDQNEAEVRSVLEGERFIKQNRLHSDSINAGDVFKDGRKIYINIRPDCDCIPKRCTTGQDPDRIDLYLLRGNKLAKIAEGKLYSKKYGNFSELDSQSIIFSMLEGHTYDFRFKDLIIKPWSEMRSKRIGRLLPPYITRIQQRYALYLQRQSMPRIPNVFD